MSHVTYGTAMLLKYSKFPQPKLAVGQVWYNQSGAPSVIVRNMGDELGTGETHWKSCSLENGEIGNVFPESRVIDKAFFAPTSVELLESLPPKTLAGFNNGEWSVMPATTEMVFTHRNPAEAAAMAWLALNKKA